MKPSEFREIKQKFIKEQKFWESLKVGQTIYDEQSRWFDFDYHEMIIDEIDVENRCVKARDVYGTHRATLHGFLTEEQFNKKFPKK